MDEKIPYRILTRERFGIPSFDLDVSQLHSDNAGFLARLKVDKLRLDSRTKIAMIILTFPIAR